MPAEKKASDRDRRAADRLERVQAGAAELELFLKDLLRQGLLTLPDKGAAFFEKTAARMVDAKAPGLAQLVRAFNELPYHDGSTEWHSQALALCARTWLLLEAFQQFDTLPPPVQDDLRSLLGWTIKRNEILENQSLERIEDDWLCAGRMLTLEEDLLVLRQWFVGLRSQRSALLLDFAHKTQPPPTSLFLTGKTQRATFVFYPSNRPERALALAEPTGSTKTPSDFASALPHPTWAAAQRDCAVQLARFPWADDLLLCVRELVLARHEGAWFLRDTEGAAWPLSPEFEEARTLHLLAISGANPLTMFVLKRKEKIFPLGVFAQSTYWGL
jgi:hypothetical protein